MEKNIVLNKLQQEAIDFIKLPDSIKKNIIYNNKFRHRRYSESSILVKEDGTTYYAESILRISKGKRFYLKKEARSGFTVEPKGRMKIWYGRNINTINNMHLILKSLNKEWVKKEYIQFITPSIMGKIIANKITNPHDLFKNIIKMYRAECSISKLISIIDNGKNVLSKNTLLKGIYTAKNLDHYLDYLNENHSNEYSSFIFDMMDEACTLERKINFRWSLKRMMLEHRKWTLEIMDHMSDDLSKDKLNWLNNLRLPKSKLFKLIDNESDCYLEGKIMRHCVYTAYWNNLKNARYIVYHINDDTMSGATLGILINNNTFKIHQLNGINNANPSNKAKEISVKILQKIIENNPNYFEQQNHMRALTDETDFAFDENIIL